MWYSAAAGPAAGTQAGAARASNPWSARAHPKAPRCEQTPQSYGT
eukprot:CAMPEP_0184990048 /NCGR_PEP_ID=MMETSP1098-20130426/30746_1 /TAXON_ID=89044 /ORGANISM="Spumella elongata, Strain CCAP 955/1" /LENGTH=44 /DNA_ID= /DNA_START= /DNA_END= /DNA_ORIENTATION=